MNSYLKTTLLISWGGVLFTGIICGTKLFVGDWLLAEPSPYFLWFPSWWFCFGLFVAVFLSTALSHGKSEKQKMLTVSLNTVIAFLGSLLAGRLVAEVILAQFGQDLPPADYVIMFPWSLYVLTLFTTIFVFSATLMLLGPKRMEKSAG
ncbi:MAG: hypothetical protein U9Q03_04595 [Patescibacteria group bacterium]|nr:hypothetical protein [Patescibacteria group bacterium]